MSMRFSLLGDASGGLIRKPPHPLAAAKLLISHRGIDGVGG
jgi:hypothetical protein